MKEELGDAGRLLLVTGSGRSGTSTVTGALVRLGFHIPQPEVPPDETNPRGFYEPRWVVDLHKRLLSDLPARTNDARPSVMELTTAYADDADLRAELVAWLRDQVEAVGDGVPLAVKDPRLFWFHQLWKRCAEEAGLQVGFLTMLRHPAQVAKSRDAHYLSDRTEEFRRARQTGSIAGWVNGSLQTDYATRGYPRAFVRYDDLMGDWRAALAAAGDHLGMDLRVASGEHHPVDDFIDTKLHRSRVTWDDTETLPALREMAEQVWAGLNELVDDPGSAEALRALAEQRDAYEVLHGYAQAITHDHTSCAVVSERRRVRETLQHRIRKLRRQLDDARQPAAETGAGPQRPAARRRSPGRWLRGAFRS